MKVKDPRRIHGSEVVAGRWDHLGFVAGGTGIAPFVQIISALLANKTDTTSLSLLSVNRRHEDILMKAEIDDLSKQSNGRFRVTYALTQPTSDDQERVDFVRGRGDASLALKALPPPLESTRTPPNEEVGVSASAEVEDHRSSPLGGAQEGGTMVMVCGTDGFVDSWAGAITRTKDPATGKKAKLQGPLMGWLRDAGFREQEVYKF
jgi:NAD(P)H-flavin reductase